MLKKLSSIDVDPGIFEDKNRLQLSPSVIFVQHILQDKDGKQQQGYVNTLHNFDEQKFVSVSNIMFAKVVYTLISGSINEKNAEYGVTVDISPAFMQPGVTYLVPTIIQDNIYKFVLREDEGKLDCWIQKPYTSSKKNKKVKKTASKKQPADTESLPPLL